MGVSCFIFNASLTSTCSNGEVFDSSSSKLIQRDLDINEQAVWMILSGTRLEVNEESVDLSMIESVMMESMTVSEIEGDQGLDDEEEEVCPDMEEDRQLVDESEAPNIDEGQRLVDDDNQVGAVGEKEAEPEGNEHTEHEEENQSDLDGLSAAQEVDVEADDGVESEQVSCFFNPIEKSPAVEGHKN